MPVNSYVWSPTALFDISEHAATTLPPRRSGVNTKFTKLLDCRRLNPSPLLKNHPISPASSIYVRNGFGNMFPILFRPWIVWHPHQTQANRPWWAERTKTPLAFESLVENASNKGMTFQQRGPNRREVRSFAHHLGAQLREIVCPLMRQPQILTALTVLRHWSRPMRWAAPSDSDALLDLPNFTARKCQLHAFNHRSRACGTSGGLRNRASMFLRSLTRRWVVTVAGQTGLRRM